LPHPNQMSQRGPAPPPGGPPPVAAAAPAAPAEQGANAQYKKDLAEYHKVRVSGGGAGARQCYSPRVAASWLTNSMVFACPVSLCSHPEVYTTRHTIAGEGRRGF
jgi:hypothetical protein